MASTDIFVFCLIFLFLVPVSLYGQDDAAVKLKTEKRMEQLQGLYNKGLEYYLQYDYQKASEIWQEALAMDPENVKIKEFLDRAQQRWFEAASLLIEGRELFYESEYDRACWNFGESLRLTPLNPETAYWLKLCNVPKVAVEPVAELFTPGTKDNRVRITLDTSDSVSNWVKKWEIGFRDLLTGEVIRTIGGSYPVPGSVEWDLKDGDGQLYREGEKVLCGMRLTSFFGRDVFSATNEILIDTVGPEVQVQYNHRFTPRDEKKQKNKVEFRLELKDAVTGPAKARIDIHNEERDRLLQSLPVENFSRVVWDGRLSDGSILEGGRKVYFTVTAFDKAGNRTVTPPRLITADFYYRVRERIIVMNLPNLEFEVNSSELSDEAKARLEQAAVQLTDLIDKYHDVKFTVVGHTDDRGSDQHNQVLSENRARAVCTVLKRSSKIRGSRFKVEGRGEKAPLVPNNNETNRAINRRVEIEVRGTELTEIAE